MNTRQSFRTRCGAILLIFSTLSVFSIHSMDDPRFAHLRKQERVEGCTALCYAGAAGVVGWNIALGMACSQGCSCCCGLTFFLTTLIITLYKLPDMPARALELIQADMRDVEAYFASSAGDNMRQQDARLSECQRVILDLEHRLLMHRETRIALVDARNDCMRLRNRVCALHRQDAW